MASPFAQALKDMDARLDEHMGERIFVTPMLRSDFDVIEDPDRAAFEVVALVDDVDPSTTPIPGHDTRVTYEEMVVEIRYDLLPPDFRFRKGDEIEFLERPNSPSLFKVTAPPERLDQERLVLKLGPIGESSA